MHKILDIIPEASYEVIGDQLANILTIEINRQSAITYDETIDATVFRERSNPFDLSDLPAVNISLAEGKYDNQKFNCDDGTYEFEIDVYTKAKTTDDEGGDKIATLTLHKIIRIIRYVLRHPVYKTLNFEPGLIAHTEVREFKIRDPKGKQDAESVKMGRLFLIVKAIETTTEEIPKSVVDYTTQVLVNESDDGYIYQLVNS